MLLRNLTTGATLATKVVRANTMWTRIRGFLFRNAVSPNEAIWFPCCSTIHTIGMRVPLDVVFLDEYQRVLRLAPHVARDRLVLSCRGARSVVEFGAGALSRSDVLIGDRLVFEDDEQG